MASPINNSAAPPSNTTSTDAAPPSTSTNTTNGDTLTSAASSGSTSTANAAQPQLSAPTTTKTSLKMYAQMTGQSSVNSDIQLGVNTQEEDQQTTRFYMDIVQRCADNIQKIDSRTQFYGVALAQNNQSAPVNAAAAALNSAIAQYNINHQAAPLQAAIANYNTAITTYNAFVPSANAQITAANMYASHIGAQPIPLETLLAPVASAPLPPAPIAVGTSYPVPKSYNKAADFTLSTLSTDSANLQNIDDNIAYQHFNLRSNVPPQSPNAYVFEKPHPQAAGGASSQTGLGGLLTGLHSPALDGQVALAALTAVLSDFGRAPPSKDINAQLVTNQFKLNFANATLQLLQRTSLLSGVTVNQNAGELQDQLRPGNTVQPLLLANEFSKNALKLTQSGVTAAVAKQLVATLPGEQARPAAEQAQLQQAVTGLLNTNLQLFALHNFSVTLQAPGLAAQVLAQAVPEATPLLQPPTQAAILNGQLNNPFVLQQIKQATVNTVVQETGLSLREVVPAVNAAVETAAQAGAVPDVATLAQNIVATLKQGIPATPTAATAPTSPTVASAAAATTATSANPATTAATTTTAATSTTTASTAETAPAVATPAAAAPTATATPAEPTAAEGVATPAATTTPSTTQPALASASTQQPAISEQNGNAAAATPAVAASLAATPAATTPTATPAVKVGKTTTATTATPVATTAVKTSTGTAATTQTPAAQTAAGQATTAQGTTARQGAHATALKQALPTNINVAAIVANNAKLAPVAGLASTTVTTLLNQLLPSLLNGQQPALQTVGSVRNALASQLVQKGLTSTQAFTVSNNVAQLIAKEPIEQPATATATVPVVDTTTNAAIVSPVAATTTTTTAATTATPAAVTTDTNLQRAINVEQLQIGQADLITFVRGQTGITTQTLQTALQQATTGTNIGTAADLQTAVLNALVTGGATTPNAQVVSSRVAAFAANSLPPTTASATANVVTNLSAAPLNLSPQQTQQVTTGVALAVVNTLPLPELRASELDRPVDVSTLKPADFINSPAGSRTLAGLQNPAVAQAALQPALQSTLQQGQFDTVRDLRSGLVQGLVNRQVGLQDAITVGNNFAVEVGNNRLGQTSSNAGTFTAANLSSGTVQSSLQNSLVQQASLNPQEAATISQAVVEQLVVGAQKQPLQSELAFQNTITHILVDSFRVNAEIARRVSKEVSPLPPPPRTSEEILTGLGLTQGLDALQLREAINDHVLRHLPASVRQTTGGQEIAATTTHLLVGTAVGFTQFEQEQIFQSLITPEQRDRQAQATPISITRVISDSVGYLRRMEKNQAVAAAAQNFHERLNLTYDGFAIYNSIYDPAKILSQSKWTSIQQSGHDQPSFQNTISVLV